MSHEALAVMFAAFLTAGGWVLVAVINKVVRNGKTTTLDSVDARVSLVNEHLDVVVRKHEADLEDVRRRLDTLENHR